MKIREGFVSNSSSSSFIVIDKKVKIDSKVFPIVIGDTLTIPRKGETWFSGTGESFHDFDSKLNFLILQALYLDNAKYYNNILEVLQEHFKGKNIQVNLRIENDDIHDEKSELVYGLIDHQSVGGAYRIMLEFKEDIKNFLFSTESSLFITHDSDDERFYDKKFSIDKEEYIIYSYDE